MGINFTKLTENILLENVNESQTIKDYIIQLLDTVPDYKQSLGNFNSTQKFDILKNYALGIWKNQPYTSETDLINNTAYLPIIDFLASDVYSKGKTKDLDISVNKSVGDFKNEIQNPSDQANFINKIQTLNVPSNYTFTINKIQNLVTGQQTLASKPYKTNTPLDAVLKAIEKIGGFNSRTVTEILEYPGKYNTPETVKLSELKPIQKISEALYWFYINKIKTPNYISHIKASIPELQNQPDETVQQIIDDSIGEPSPKNSKLQDDYKQFLRGNSKLLVQFVVGECFSHLVTNILQEDVRPSSWKPSAQQQPQPQPQPQQQPQQQTTPQAKPLKATATPLIRSLQDFSRQGYSGDKNVEQAYNVFYTYLIKGTTPSGWQTAANITGNVLGGLFNAIGNVGSGLKGF